MNPTDEMYAPIDVLEYIQHLGVAGHLVELFVEAFVEFDELCWRSVLGFWAGLVEEGFEARNILCGSAFYRELYPGHLNRTAQLVQVEDLLRIQSPAKESLAGPKLEKSLDTEPIERLTKGRAADTQFTCQFPFIYPLAWLEGKGLSHDAQTLMSPINGASDWAVRSRFIDRWSVLGHAALPMARILEDISYTPVSVFASSCLQSRVAVPYPASGSSVGCLQICRHIQ